MREDTQLLYVDAGVHSRDESEERSLLLTRVYTQNTMKVLQPLLLPSPAASSETNNFLKVFEKMKRK